jgi:hypothetical protein
MSWAEGAPSPARARTVRRPRVDWSLIRFLLINLGFPNRLGSGWPIGRAVQSDLAGFGCKAGLAVGRRELRRGRTIRLSGRNPRQGRVCGPPGKLHYGNNLSARGCERMTNAHQHGCPLSSCHWDRVLRSGLPAHDRTDAEIFSRNEHSRESRRRTQSR